MEETYICNKCGYLHKVIEYGAQPGRAIFDDIADIEYYFCENCALEFNSIFMPMRSKLLHSFIQPERLSEKTSKEDAIV